MLLNQIPVWKRLGPAAALALITSLAGAALNAAELDAAQIMWKAENRDDGDSAITDYTLVLIDRRERQRQRELKMYAKDYGDDTRSLSWFESPADIRGTAYLNYDWADPDTDDDSWLYLPSLQRVKRIATSDTSDSFLGSDFTYADINGLELEWYDFTLLKDSEIVDGHDCWVIEIVPKPEFRDKAEDATGYSKLQTWVRKDNFVKVQGQAWELRGNQLKYFTSTEIKQIDGIWTVGRMQVITTRGGRREHASVLQVNEVRYNVELQDSLFTTEAMQRGLD